MKDLCCTFIHKFKLIHRNSFKILPVSLSWSFWPIHQKGVRVGCTTTSKNSTKQTFRMLEFFPKSFERIYENAITFLCINLLFLLHWSYSKSGFIGFLTDLPLRRRSICLHSSTNMADFPAAMVNRACDVKIEC